ncbi:MAG: aromatic amino acid ammonia-lyase [Burkholderiales bacterium]|jgi:histidine ammonia-lyase|nr:aromatic amino acid ammonia-lyase [Burkholderiales bacterium]
MNTHPFTHSRTILFDHRFLSVNDISDVADRRANVALSDDAAFRARIQKGADYLDQLLEKEKKIYGVTTGYGDSCTVDVPMELVDDLPHHLYSYHGCGLGDYLTLEQTRAVLAVRLASLAKGYSGVSVALLEQIARFLQHDVLPLIPSEGSVGASGDLTPLSYLAATLCGEREVMFEGKIQKAKDVLTTLHLSPVRLRPKEGLALMNGTAVMTGLACLAYRRAEYVMTLAARITSMASVVLNGNAYHFDQTLFLVKPHAGQQQIASWIRDDLKINLDRESPPNRLQDRYSIRCAPHVIGVLADALPLFKQFIENELNSANDNPIIDPEGEQVLHGGHFYGGHIAFAMDSMKNAVANIADLLDRQMALMVDTRYNQGLPSNLSGSSQVRAQINHGLKALQISASAWTAEALKLTMPASVFSRSTECHNQDKVSMGTIAARDCCRVLTLTEQVVAALLITVRQGMALRLAQNNPTALSSSLRAMYEALSKDIPFIDEDRRLEPDLRRLVGNIQQKAWKLYE